MSVAFFFTKVNVGIYLQSFHVKALFEAARTSKRVQSDDSVSSSLHSLVVNSADRSIQILALEIFFFHVHQRKFFESMSGGINAVERY